jgi:hypothetical protein
VAQGRSDHGPAITGKERLALFNLSIEVFMLAD